MRLLVQVLQLAVEVVHLHLQGVRRRHHALGVRAAHARMAGRDTSGGRRAVHGTARRVATRGVRPVRTRTIRSWSVAGMRWVGTSLARRHWHPLAVRAHGILRGHATGVLLLLPWLHRTRRAVLRSVRRLWTTRCRAMRTVGYGSARLALVRRLLRLAGMWRLLLLLLAGMHLSWGLSRLRNRYWGTSGSRGRYRLLPRARSGRSGVGSSRG